jgi:hypothetical protein
MGKEVLQLTGAMTPRALAHYDVSGAIVDYDADADFGAERLVCHIATISHSKVDVVDVKVDGEVVKYDWATNEAKSGGASAGSGIV